MLVFAVRSSRMETFPLAAGRGITFESLYDFATAAELNLRYPVL